MIAALLVAIAVAVAMPERGRRGSPSPWPLTPTTVMRTHSMVRSATRRVFNRQRSRTRTRARATQWIDAVVAELRAGRPPRTALIAAADAMVTAHAEPPCPRTRAAAALGGDIASALGADSRAARLPVLSHVAACWIVAESTGSGLAPALEQVLESARADEEVRAEIEAQLAAPRATARLLAVLPLVGLLLGTSLGAQPVHWLTASPLGWLVFALGVSEIALGLWWTSRMVRSLEREITGPVRS